MEQMNLSFLTDRQYEMVFQMILKIKINMLDNVNVNTNNTTNSKSHIALRHSYKFGE